MGRIHWRVVWLALLAVCLFGAGYAMAHGDEAATAGQSGQPAISSQSTESTPGMHMDHGASDEHGMAEEEHGEHMHMGTPAPGVFRLLLIVTLAIAASLMFFAHRSMRTPAAAPATVRSNLFDRPVIGRILRSKLFLNLLIFPTLAIFAFIVITGFFGQQNTGNPAVLLTWILWWPAVIFTFFLVGRIWCAMCPFGYMGDVMQKIFSFRLKVPAIFKNMWWRLAFFLALTWATTMLALDRWPEGTAWLALGETLGAMALAVVYEKRAFCRFLCPVGGIFGLYSMAAPVRLGVKDSKVCHEECPEKNCFSACSWFQYPPTVDRNAECSLCMECVRACPKDNLALRTQSFGSDLMRFKPHRKSVDEAIAIFAILGVALVQTVVMLHGWQTFETKLGGWLDLSRGDLLFTISYIGLGVIVPVLLVALVVWLAGFPVRSHGGLSNALRSYAFCFLPLGLALHAAHNFHHLFGEGGAMWVGVKNYMAHLLGFTVAADPAPGAPTPNTLFVMQWVALIGGLYLAYRVAVALVRRQGFPSKRAFQATIPLLLFATAYTIMNLWVLAQAMSDRH